jgi:hypothetical protein
MAVTDNQPGQVFPKRSPLGRLGVDQRELSLHSITDTIGI